MPFAPFLRPYPFFLVSKVEEWHRMECLHLLANKKLPLVFGWPIVNHLDVLNADGNNYGADKLSFIETGLEETEKIQEVDTNH